MTEYKAVLTCTDKHLHDWFAIVCSDTLVREQTTFMTAYSVLLGTTLTSDTVWRYFFKAVQRPSLLPKDSDEFRGWYDTLPQTQPKQSEAYQAWQKATPQMQPKESEAYQAWQKATPQLQPKESEAYQAWHQVGQKANPQMQPKKSEAFREWLQAVRGNASQRSVDSHQWFKSKPPTADTDVRRSWYSVGNAIAPCTDCRHQLTDLPLPTVWAKLQDGKYQKGHSQSPQPYSKQEVSRPVLRV